MAEVPYQVSAARGNVWKCVSITRIPIMLKHYRLHPVWPYPIYWLTRAGLRCWQRREARMEALFSAACHGRLMDLQRFHEVWQCVPDGGNSGRCRSNEKSSCYDRATLIILIPS
jgi:hypothetical protein